jgi:hypothetical protein
MFIDESIIFDEKQSFLRDAINTLHVDAIESYRNCDLTISSLYDYGSKGVELPHFWVIIDIMALMSHYLVVRERLNNIQSDEWKIRQMHKKYGFFDIKKVRTLSDSAKKKLFLKIIDPKSIKWFTILLYKHIGFIEHIQFNHAHGIEDELHRIIERNFGISESYFAKCLRTINPNSDTYDLTIASKRIKEVENYYQNLISES